MNKIPPTVHLGFLAWETVACGKSMHAVKRDKEQFNGTFHRTTCKKCRDAVRASGPLVCRRIGESDE